jgi:RsiW-degrading membrane proteinase PrsW (M82 family)
MFLILVPILAFIPALFWFFIFLKEDRFDPEPKKLLIKLFILGAAAGFLAGLLESAFFLLTPAVLEQAFANFLSGQGLPANSISLITIVILTIIGLVAIEEILKIGVVKKFAFNEPHFTQIVDGAIFGISAALGFAVLENLGYFFEIAVKQGIAVLMVTFVLRFFASTLMHALTTGVSGYYLGRAKFSGKMALYWRGLILAIAIHSGFNILLAGGIIGIGLDIGLLMVTLVFLLKRMESFEAQIIWRLVYLKDLKVPQA